MLLRSKIEAAVFAHGSPIDEVYLSTKIWTRLKEVGMTDCVVRSSNPVLPDFVAIWIVSDRAERAWHSCLDWLFELHIRDNHFDIVASVFTLIASLQWEAKKLGFCRKIRYQQRNPTDNWGESVDYPWRLGSYFFAPPLSCASALRDRPNKGSSLLRISCIWLGRDWLLGGGIGTTMGDIEISLWC